MVNIVGADPPATSDGADVLPQTTQSDLLVHNVQATTHSVDDGFGLLKDFLLHEVIEFVFHNLLQL
jgi:hypothetical protein